MGAAKIWKVERTSIVLVPVMGRTAHAGFPSPADDYVEDTIDLNDILIRNSVATFIWKVAGDCMIDARIFHSDRIIVDRSLTPKHRSIVLAVIDGEPAVKRLIKRHGVIRLINENHRLPPFEPGESADITIWGVVTWALRDLAP
ncbi:LexA family protein [Pelagibacterium sp.]|uniref:LexA family protein n=1 Tax=Pelagibacterium sp. TaxID=1967288 RepID=UPI003A951973